MTILEKYRDECNAHGELTTLARAVEALTDTECDCVDCVDGACLPRACERALIEVIRERNDALAKLAKVRQELAATPECDCGTCLACRVADVVGA